MKKIGFLGSDLLGALSEEDRAHMIPLLEEQQIRSGTIIIEPGEMVRHAYFPRQDSLVAFLIPMADGETVECAMVGREGVVGAVSGEGHLPAYTRCCVHHGGAFFRMPTAALEELRAKRPMIDDLFNRYADCMSAQLFQSIACNARHSIEQRAARWLCAAMNRTGSLDIPLTQAQLGGFLGVGRSYLSRVLGRFRAQGVLGTKRGMIVIRKPHKLYALSCDCTAIVAEHCAAVTRMVYPARKRVA